ncbi:glycoside hydrolase family 44 protein [Myxococcaceae bacterium GXIMD 01537]
MPARAPQPSRPTRGPRRLSGRALAWACLLFAGCRSQAHAAEGAREVRVVVDCTAPGHPISPLIYGIALDGRREAQDTHQWKLGATARRWGGNPSSRYNWKHGGAWNVANDWYFRNVPTVSWEAFLDANRAHGVRSTVTLPMLGWVAKDTQSVGFPVARVGAQQRVDPARPEAGNGVGRDGKPLPPPPPTQTSIEAPPAFVAEWVRAIRAREEAAGTPGPRTYILDNEPMLWSSTHRDVHPEPLTYEGLLRRTVEYGTAVRAADPEAVLAGPAEWGWTNWFYSAADVAPGVRGRPDHQAHGRVPLLVWYLRQLRAHEERTGVRLLDVVDVHFYPQSRVGVGTGGATDPETNARRLRSTRALWDETYRDESWIADRVRLIPRLKEWISESYPGRGISIGEYNFGAAGHMSGGLAQAEALGRFAQGGLTSAYYWEYPPENSPAFWAFRAYRDFDGRGGRFLDTYVPSTVEGDLASLFASRDGRHLVAVALNLDPGRAADARVELRGCGKLDTVRVLDYAEGASGFQERASGPVGGGVLTRRLPPYSMTVLDVTVKP